MNDAERIAELEKQLAEAQAQKAAAKPTHYIKIGNKNNVVFGGTGLRQRFPVTLYAPGWEFLLNHADEIRAFIEENRDQLSWER